MAYDAEFQQATARTFERLGLPSNRPTPRFARGDIGSRRQGTSFIKVVLALEPVEYPEIERTEHIISGHEQVPVSVISYRISKAPTSSPEPAVLYIHGGGMIFGSSDLFEPMIKADVAATGVAHFSIDYRLCPEVRHPTPVEDCYSALTWLSTHAQELSLDPKRIGVVGLSAGGGLAAGVALLARDRKLNPPIAKQILLCPMLDDRTTVTDKALLPWMTWSWDDNWTGWDALLGDEVGTGSVSEYAAPAQASYLGGLPAAYIDVGSMDIFAQEDRLYAERLGADGVEVEWHLYDGVPHGFEFRGGGSTVLRQALAFRRTAICSL